MPPRSASGAMTRGAEMAGAQMGITIASVGALPARKGAPIVFELSGWAARSRRPDRRDGSLRPRLPAAAGRGSLETMGMRPPGEAVASSSVAWPRHRQRDRPPHQVWRAAVTLWDPMEREHEFRRVMYGPDRPGICPSSRRRAFCAGRHGCDEDRRQFFPRITEFHLKDTAGIPRQRRHLCREGHYRGPSVYAAVGQGGGVDFPGLFAVMRRRDLGLGGVRHRCAAYG